MMVARLGSRLPGMAPAALASLRRGLMLLRWAVLASVIGILAAMAGLTVSMLLFDDGFDSAIESAMGFLFAMALPAGLVVGLLCWVVGWFLVGRAFGDAVLLGTATRARGVVRRFLVGGVAFLCVALVLSAWQAASDAAMVILGVSLVFFGVSTCAGMWMLRAIGTRTLEGRLVGGATQLMVTSPLAVLGAAALFLGSVFDEHDLDGWLGMVLGLTPCVAMVWPIGLVLLVDRLWRLTRRAAAVVAARG